MTIATETPTLQEIPLGELSPSPYQTRRFTDAGRQDLEELAESIRQLGVLEPVLVRPDSHGPTAYQLLAGERRLRAARLAGLDTVPAIVRDLDDDAALEVTVTENLHREDLHPLDEAAAIDLMMKRYGDVDEVAARIGRPRSFVTRRARLTTLSSAWQAALAYRPRAVENNGNPCRNCGNTPELIEEMEEEGAYWVEPDLCDACGIEEGASLDLSGWGVTHLEVIARLAPADQDEFLENGLDRWNAENVTVAQLERQTDGWLRQLSAAPWSCSDPDLVPEAGACTECPQRASVHPGLFDDVEEGKGIPAGDRCLMPSCWDRKLEAHIASVAEQLEADTGDEPLRLTRQYLSDSQLKKRGLTYAGHGTRTSEKPKQGHKPAIHVDGSNAGQVVYVAPASSGSTSTTRGAAPKKTAAEKLAAGEERLGRRRTRRRIELVLEQVKGSKPPKVAELLAITTLLGTRYNKDGMYAGYGSRDVLNPVRNEQLPEELRRKTVWSIVAGLDASVNAALRDHLWMGQLIPLFESRWNYVGSHSPVDTQWRECQALCELLKIDAVAIAREVEDELPEPKSWAKLREQIKAEKADARKAKKKRGKEAAAA